MRVFIWDTTGVYRHKIERELGKDATGQQVLDYLFGPYGEDSRSSVNYVIREWRKDTRTKLQRLNMLWAVPLTIALWPFRYVLYGDGGWSTKTPMGRFILRITGYLKDAEENSND